MSIASSVPPPPSPPPPPPPVCLNSGVRGASFGDFFVEVTASDIQGARNLQSARSSAFSPSSASQPSSAAASSRQQQADSDQQHQQQQQPLPLSLSQHQYLQQPTLKLFEPKLGSPTVGQPNNLLSQSPTSPNQSSTELPSTLSLELPPLSPQPAESTSVPSQPLQQPPQQPHQQPRQQPPQPLLDASSNLNQFTSASVGDQSSDSKHLPLSAQQPGIPPLVFPNLQQDFASTSSQSGPIKISNDSDSTAPMQSSQLASPSATSQSHTYPHTHTSALAQAPFVPKHMPFLSSPVLGAYPAAPPPPAWPLVAAGSLSPLSLSATAAVAGALNQSGAGLDVRISTVPIPPPLPDGQLSAVGVSAAPQRIVVIGGSTTPGPDVSPPLRFQCSVCGKCFNAKEDEIKHFKANHESKPFGCDQCGKVFPSKSRLMRHQRGHNGIRPYPCKLCGLAFAEAGSLGRHMRVHADIKPFECSICHIKCRFKWDLKSHMVCIHQQPTEHQCPVCGVYTITRTKLLRHVRTHKPKPGKSTT